MNFFSFSFAAKVIEGLLVTFLLWVLKKIVSYKKNNFQTDLAKPCVKFNTAARIIIAVCDLIWCVAAGLSLYASSIIAMYIFVVLALANFVILLWVFTFELYWDGVQITARSIGGQKEFYKTDILKKEYMANGDVIIRFTNGKLLIDGMCTGKEEFFSYVYEALEQNAQKITEWHRQRIEGDFSNGFWCRTSIAELFVIFVCAAVFGTLDYFLGIPEFRAGRLDWFSALALVVFTVLPLVWFFTASYSWVKVVPQKNFIYLHLFFRKKITLEQIESVTGNKNIITFFYCTKNSKRRKFRTYLTYANAQYMIDFFTLREAQKQ